MRVPHFLREQHIAFETLLHAPAFTAQRRAKYLHVSGRQVAKNVLLAGPAGYVLAVLPAPRSIDAETLAGELGGPVRLAADPEIADVFPDCEWGVVPPFGSLYGGGHLTGRFATAGRLGRLRGELPGRGRAPALPGL
jgi:Ala-tRNA(Pro) deacylase